MLASLYVNILPFAMLHAMSVHKQCLFEGNFVFSKPERQCCTFSSQSNGQPSFDRRCREPRRSCLGLDLNRIRVLDDGRAWLLLWWPGA